MGSAYLQGYPDLVCPAVAGRQYSGSSAIQEQYSLAVHQEGDPTRPDLESTEPSGSAAAATAATAATVSTAPSESGRVGGRGVCGAGRAGGMFQRCGLQEESSPDTLTGACLDAPAPAAAAGEGEPMLLQPPAAAMSHSTVLTEIEAAMGSRPSAAALHPPLVAVAARQQQAIMFARSSLLLTGGMTKAGQSGSTQSLVSYWSSDGSSSGGPVPGRPCGAQAEGSSHSRHGMAVLGQGHSSSVGTAMCQGAEGSSHSRHGTAALGQGHSSSVGAVRLESAGSAGSDLGGLYQQPAALLQPAAPLQPADEAAPCPLQLELQPQEQREAVAGGAGQATGSSADCLPSSAWDRDGSGGGSGVGEGTGDPSQLTPIAAACTAAAGCSGRPPLPPPPALGASAATAATTLSPVLRPLASPCPSPSLSPSLSPAPSLSLSPAPSPSPSPSPSPHTRGATSLRRYCSAGSLGRPSLRLYGASQAGEGLGAVWEGAREGSVEGTSDEEGGERL